MAQTDLAGADKPLTMKLDLQPPTQAPVDEKQLLLPSTAPADDGTTAATLCGPDQPPSSSSSPSVPEAGKEKRGPWPGKKCAVAMIEGDGMPRRCVDTQPRSDDNPRPIAWCSDEQPEPPTRCDDCALSFWICIYNILSCCEYPCKDSSK